MEKLGCTVVTSRLDTREEPLYENHFREWRVVTDADTMKLYRKFDDNIHWKADLLSYKKDDPSIDYYVAGSDQLWNPIFNFGSDREFLRFTKPEKRIAYAASIGIKELPLESIDNFRNGFEGIENITMRENAGADIVETLTKKRPGVVLDPTMLLDDKDWDKIAESSNVKLDENFVVKYILGIHNPELDTMVDDYAREHGCKVIDLIKHESAGINGIGPAEFLYLSKHSKANFVDSYHGAVFSILFKKPFLAFYRPAQKEYGDMNSRFETLFDTFNLKNHFISEKEEFGTIYDDIDYERIDAILDTKRDEAKEYLLHSLKLD